MVYGSVYGSTGSHLTDVEAAVYDESLSFDEVGALVVEESVNDWNQMMRSIAISELSYVMENHKEMVYEAVDIKALKDKIVGWFKKLWARVKALADTAIAKFMSWGKNDEGFIEKYEDKIAAGVGNLKSGFSFNGYKFNKANMSGYPDLVNKQAKAEISNTDDMVSGAKNTAKVTGKGLTGDFKEEIKAYRGKLCGSESKSSDTDFKKALRKYFYGSESKVPIHKNDIDVGDIMSDVKGCKDAIEGAKEMETTVKDSIDECIDRIESASEEVKGMSDGANNLEKDNIRGAASYLQKIGAYMKQIETVNAAAFTTYISALKDRNRQNKALCVKLVSATNIKDTPMKESAGSLLSGKFAEVIL